VVVTVAADIGSAGDSSSVSGGSAGSTLFRGGEFVFGRLAVDKVGELVLCCPGGGVELEPVEWV
jgi:hypothetical protein